jgi:hypothetical protein
MTIGKIAYKVAKFLQKSRAYFIDEGGDDLIINALNNARINAERLHDFAAQQGRVGVTITPASGGDVINASYLMSGDELSGTLASVKTIETAYLQDSTNHANWYPLLLDPKRLLAKKAKEQNYHFRGWPTTQYSDSPLSRYPGDARNFESSRPYRAYWQGDYVFLDPRPSANQTFIFDANLWMTDYTSNFVNVLTSSTASTSVTLVATKPTNLVVGVNFLGSVVTAASGTSVTLATNANATIATSTAVPYIASNSDAEDWMCEQGADYLMWAAVVECNMYTSTFVPRQEGFNAPPEKMRDKALEALILHDDYKFELAREPLLIR